MNLSIHTLLTVLFLFCVSCTEKQEITIKKTPTKTAESGDQSKVSVGIVSTQAENSPLAERHNYLLTHIYDQVHPQLKPVLFLTGPNLTSMSGYGTAVLDADGKPAFLVTANHLFRNDSGLGSKIYRFSYLRSNGRHVPGGYVGKVEYNYLSNSNTPEGIEDVALCHISNQPTEIKLESDGIISADKPITSSFSIGPIDHREARSLITGNRYDIVGQMVTDAGAPYFVMLYDSMNGESGSGFLGNDNVLYIVAGSGTVTPELIKKIPATSGHKTVTVLAAVNVHF